MGLGFRCGFIFLGKLDEERLLGVAYAFEQRMGVRGRIMLEVSPKAELGPGRKKGLAVQGVMRCAEILRLLLLRGT